MNESIGKRIKRLRKIAQMSQAQLAEACGWKSQSRIGNYEADSREPSFADIEAMATALRVDKSELLLDLREAPLESETGRSNSARASSGPEHGSSSADLVRQMLAQHGRGLSAEARRRIVAAAAEPDAAAETVISGSVRARNDEILIPQYDIRGAMGHGQVPADYNEAIRNLIVREEVLREKGVTYTSSAALAVITGWGQSMEGTINDKDPVIVDRGVNEFVGEGIYVITWLDLLYIKRLQMIDADHFRLISDSPHYDNQPARVEDVMIHAKVLLVWNARKV
jgi:transcriptional regulator with XRE-family HTH domain